MQRSTKTALLFGALAGSAATMAALTAAPWYYQPRGLTRLMQRHWGEVVFEVETRKPAFALTFDDGPHPPYTDAVLDTLAEHDARATFFVMGEQVERHPEVFHRLVDEGHEVGNHFYDDRPTILLPDDDTVASLERTEAILGLQNPNRLVRPASGFLRRSQLNAIRARGYTVVIGSAYTSDPLNPPRAYMKWAFKQMLEPGRIVILHDGRKERQRTVDVLPAILDEASRLGLQAVSVSELLATSRT